MAAVMQKLQGIYTQKFSANVAVRAGVTTRAVDYWTTKNLAERRKMDAESLIALILSDAGGEIVDAIINTVPAKERPRWAVRYLNAVRLARIEEMQAEQDEEIKQLRLSLLK